MASNDILTLAASGQATELRTEVRQRALSSFYFFVKAVLGYTDLTVEFHKGVCDFLQFSKTHRQVLLLQRGAFKTTIVKSYAIWRHAKEKIENGRDISMVIGRETDDGAKQTLREIKGHYRTNQILQWIFPEVIPPPGKITSPDSQEGKWDEHEIILPRLRPRAEPSVSCVGVGVAVTGEHYEMQIKDDLIGFSASRSETEMNRAIDWHRYSEGLFVKPEIGSSEDIVLGTYWTDSDYYHWIEENEAEYDFYIRSAVEDGRPTFPERFSMETLERIRRKQGDYIFSCQYLNDPIPREGGDFKPDWIGSYEVVDDRAVKVPKEPYPISVQYLDRVGYFDPSHKGLIGGAEHAAVVLGMDSSWNRYLLDFRAVLGGIRNGLHQVQELNDRWICRWFYEAVGAQTWLADFLVEVRQSPRCTFRLKEGDQPCGKLHRNLWMQPNLKQSTKMHKDERIRQNLQPVVEERRLFLRAGQEKARNQLLRFPTGKLKDVIDAMAGGVTYLIRPRDVQVPELGDQVPEALLQEMTSRTQTEFFCG